MQPFINPNLFLNPMYGNYMQNTMPQAQMQSVGISGKYVNDFAEINASDIPMSSPAIFAKNDRSEIQIREWSPNGQIVTTLYKPYIEPKQEEMNNVTPQLQQPLFDIKTEVLEPIFDKLSELEQQVAKLNKPAAKVVKKDGE